jgi:hypothetical protein
VTTPLTARCARPLSRGERVLGLAPFLSLSRGERVIGLVPFLSLSRGERDGVRVS